MDEEDKLRWHQPYIPQTLGEVFELLSVVLLSSPKFLDHRFPAQTLESVFFALNSGLGRFKGRLGEERYRRAVELSGRIQQHFEADPGDTNGRTHEGRLLVHDLEDIVREALRRR